MKKIVQNPFICHSIGVIGTILILHLFTGWRGDVPKTVTNSFWLVSAAYIISILIIPKVTNYLLVDRKYYILPIHSSVYSMTMLFILLFRFEYSREIIFSAFFIQIIWMYLSTFMRGEHHKIKLKMIDNFEYSDFEPRKQRIELSKFEDNLKMSDIVDGLVVDLHKSLTPEEEKFIADCSINNIPVFHSESIREMIQGKVQTSHLSENSIGTLIPNPIYHRFKQIWESLLILVTLPISLPIILISAVLIKLESRGPILFVQERVGQGGKIFKIYKLRSMTVKAVGSKDKFATEEQARVTRIGRVIRKIRIDELPQFYNVLKGDMSLIGPRPEQESFVKQFEKDIPFYGYRHMVKPGITGWAQTVQGYADSTDSTREKLAHDLYYIKHLSFWLDINIVIKTIKTMMTGFGAK